MSHKLIQDNLKQRVGFLLPRKDLQHSGHIWLRNLIRSLPSDDKLEFVIVEEADDDDPASSGQIPRHTLPKIKRGSLNWLRNAVLNRIGKQKIATSLGRTWSLKQLNLSAVVGCELSFKEPKIKTFSWLPDLQHFKLPEMFQEAEIMHRNNLFRKIINDADGLILMSESVKRDLEEFCPQSAEKAIVAPIIPDIPHEFLVDELDEDDQIKNLPQRFIYLPNQFWKHKNHISVIRALKILMEREPEVTIICTGNLADYRHPTHFEELLREICQSGLNMNFQILGRVSRRNVFALMRKSVCILNPSLFEGYGLSIAEAKIMGVPALASDLASHREIEHPDITYFNPRDIENIANSIEKLWNRSLPPRPTNLLSRYEDELRKAKKRCGETFVKSVAERLTK